MDDDFPWVRADCSGARMREDHWCPGHRQSLEEADVYHTATTSGGVLFSRRTRKFGLFWVWEKETRSWKPCQVVLFKIDTLRIASLDTWERSTSMPSLFISRTTFKYVIELTSPVSPHLLPELAEPTDPGGEIANLNLRGVRPWCVAPVGQSHVAGTHPVQGAHQRQAASDGVARLNTNLGRVKVWKSSQIWKQTKLAIFPSALAASMSATLVAQCKSSGYRATS